MEPRKNATDPASEGEAPRRADPLVGRVIAEKYRIISLLAQGGMGRVYQAEQLPLGRVVALKILKPRASFEAGDQQFQKRFLLEAATCARLSHPNTVTLFDYGQITLGNRSTFFMVMELLGGRTLAEVLRAEGPLGPARALRVAREICRSLHEAHQLGIVHRDLKPSNVMLLRTDEGERVKVLDFGIAKVLEEDQEGITQDDSVVGSPRYMAPEQIRHMDLDGRSDIYSLGILLYLMLSGQVPFAKESVVGTLMAHLTEPVPPIRERSGRELPTTVEAIVRRCLEKNAKDRYPNASALREALEQVLETLTEDDDEPLTNQLFDETTAPQPSMASVPDPEDSSQTSLAALPTPLPSAAPAPQPQPARPNRLVPIAVGAALLLLLSVVLAVVIGGKEPAPAPAPAVAAAPEVAPPAPSTVTLTILSTPSGAEVFEGEARLGVTPLSIPLQTDAVRAFELRLAGYTPGQLAVGPSTADVTQSVPLVALPVEKAPRAPASGSRGEGTRTGDGTSRPRRNLDIITER